MRSGDERGATGFLIAGSLLLLMGIAAITLDISAGYNERRQDQTAADTGAQAAGVSLIEGDSLQDVVQAARDAASTNLGGRALDWATCVDPAALDYPSDTLGVSNGTPCVSFEDNSDGVAFGRIRVRVPDQDTPTVFGKVLGALNVTTSANATVELGGDTPYKNFPSFVFALAQPGDRNCIRTGPGTDDAETCSGSATGNFGMFLPYFYSNAVGLQCRSGNQPAPNAYAIAEGVDHTLAANPGLVDPLLENGADCPSTPGPFNPNQIRFSTGNDPNVTDGLIKGGSTPTTYSGRLTRQTWGVVATIFTKRIDNRPLWSYIDDTFAATLPLGDTCRLAAQAPDNATAAVDPIFDAAMANIANCLKNDPPDGLFGADTNGNGKPDIYESPRVATVPQLHQTVPCGNPACLYDIKDFVPIFLESIYTDYGPTWTCSGMVVVDSISGLCRHDAGRAGAINKTGGEPSKKIRSVGGMVLSCGTLPGPGSGADKCKLIGSGSDAATTFLNLFFLE